LVQSSTACMPLLTATSIFGLKRRRWSSPQKELSTLSSYLQGLLRTLLTCKYQGGWLDASCISTADWTLDGSVPPLFVLKRLHVEKLHQCPEIFQRVLYRRSCTHRRTITSRLRNGRLMLLLDGINDLPAILSQQSSHRPQTPPPLPGSYFKHTQTGKLCANMMPWIFNMSTAA